MHTTREPRVHPIPILSLRPTQMTVGMREVKEKRKRFREQSAGKQGDMIGNHMIPVVYGPDERYYVVAFWGVMDNKRWVYPYDAKGERRPFKDLPKSIRDLKDDPFRSLAGELRRAGGFAKDTTPFSEFLWADFLRRQMPRKLVEDDFSKAIEKALRLAKSRDAIYLPGWCGPSEDA
jgi:hypothetical protein